MDAAIVTGLVSQVQPVANATDLDAATLLLSYLPASWEGKAMLVITTCAFLASVLPPPKPRSPAPYRMLYNVVNAIAFNFGRARNLNAPPKRKRPSKEKSEGGQS